jgi:hypothetical protein
MVTQVAEDAPAARSGLKEGDVLLQVGKKKISDPEDVFDAFVLHHCWGHRPDHSDARRSKNDFPSSRDDASSQQDRYVARFAWHNPWRNPHVARRRRDAFAVVTHACSARSHPLRRATARQAATRLQHFSKRNFIDDFSRRVLCFVEFAAGFGAREHVIVFLLTLPVM